MKKVKPFILIYLVSVLIFIVGKFIIVPMIQEKNVAYAQTNNTTEMTEGFSDEFKEKARIQFNIEKITIKDKNEERRKIATKLELTKEQKEKLKKNLIAEFQDPVFNENNITIKSNLNLDKINKMLEGTKIQCLARTFLLAEEEYNINAIALMSIVSLESGYGESERANNGSNNLTGHAVYSNKSRGTYFDSWDQCVLVTAKLLQENYVNPEGLFNKNIGFNGKSLQEINLSYSETTYWHKHVTAIAKEYLNKYQDKKGEKTNGE